MSNRFVNALLFTYLGQMCIALVLGISVGLVLGPRATVLGDIGFLVVQFVKILATPLIALAIIDAFLKTKIPARKGATLLVLSSTNALVALGIATAVAHAFPIGHHVDLNALKSALGTAAHTVTTNAPAPSFKISEFLPKSLLEPFIQNSIVGIVVFSVIFGMALRRLKNNVPELDQMAAFESVVHVALQALTVILEFVIRLLPLSIFGILAKAVGNGGIQVLAVLGVFAGVVTFGLFMHAVVYYSALLKIVGRLSPIKFFKQASPALLTAFSAASSLATLPVTLRTLEGRMRVSPESSRLAACVGTNLNHDGIILYEVAAAFFVAQIYGIHLSLSHQLTIAGMSIAAAVGIAGIPEAGLITLSLVLGSVGLPLEAVPLLLPLDWLLGRLRATTNVTSDMVVANLLDATTVRRA